MSLRSQVLQGSLYLVMREGFGMVLSIATMLLITRSIGPEQYGIFAASYGIAVFLQNFGHLGIGIYLVRQEETETGETVKLFHQAFTLFLILGIVMITIAGLAAPAIEGWSRIRGMTPVLQLLLLFSMPALLSQVPMAKLERDLQFKRVAWVELLGQLLYFIVALALAMNHAGAWAPAIAWCAQQFQSWILLSFCARYVPKLTWDSKIIQDMLAYSVGISASSWVWYLQSLIAPLVVGRFAGEAAVGYVALATRLVDVLSFAKNATYRISISALAKVQGDADRLRRAVTEGMGLQVLALGPLLVAGSWLGPLLLPMAFGPEWTPVMTVYPFIALSYLSNALFNLHSSVLYVLKKPWDVTVFHAAYVAVYAALALLLVPQFQYVGYGIAAACAIVTYWIIHLALVRAIGSPNYRLALVWWAGFGVALFQATLGWWVAIGLLGVLLLPQTRQRILGYFYSVRRLKT
jgi:O-antigen/teichoic acid export membrane protein